MNWAKALRIGQRIAETVNAASGLDRDLALAKSAAVNVLIAAEFPLGAGMRAWRAPTVPERISAALEDPEIRAWLDDWAAAPRALRAAPRKRA